MNRKKLLSETGMKTERLMEDRKGRAVLCEANKKKLNKKRKGKQVSIRSVSEKEGGRCGSSERGERKPEYHSDFK